MFYCYFASIFYSIADVLYIIIFMLSFIFHSMSHVCLSYVYQRTCLLIRFQVRLILFVLRWPAHITVDRKYTFDKRLWCRRCNKIKMPRRQEWQTNFDNVLTDSKTSVTELFTVADFCCVWRSSSVSSTDPTLNSLLRGQLPLTKIIKHNFSVNYGTSDFFV